ncbi:EutP/PduV family microcompartment system protein [Streptococcus hongkongensis]|nr:hypothetical protein NC01_02745 [Streptococcus uberis]
MKKRILVICPEDTDKLKFVEVIEGKKEIKRVDAIVYYDQTIVVPSSYLRSPWMTNHIIAMQQNASCIMMLLPSDCEFRVYSPNFAKAFRIPAIGIVIQKEKDSLQKIENCHKELKEAGLNEVFCIKLTTNEDYKNLLEKIKN